MNSATHKWGSRRFATRDDSTNNWWVALLTFGEGWHNNHHAHPTSARHGLAWYEVDLNWIGIRTLAVARPGVGHQAGAPERRRARRTTPGWRELRINPREPTGQQEIKGLTTAASLWSRRRSASATSGCQSWLWLWPSSSWRAWEPLKAE